MKTEFKVLRITASFLVVLVSWGVICPMLVSNADSDAGVLLGIALVPLTLLVPYWLLKPIFKNNVLLKSKENEKK
jgi:hypothetical protein